MRAAVDQLRTFVGRGSTLGSLPRLGHDWRLFWLLRLGVCLEFVGHGACGLNTKAGWLPYFSVFAIPEALAWRLMPIIGAVDVIVGLLALLAPRRALLGYMAVWGCFTALLRPAAGEGGWEFIERAYNYGVPFALLFWCGAPSRARHWFTAIQSPPPLFAGNARALLWILRAIVGLMLIGHGGFGAFMAKTNLLSFYDAAGLGVFGLPLETIRPAIGFFEIALGMAALSASRPAFFCFVFAWKLATESLYLVAAAPLACWEIVERGGSYVAPLAIICILHHLRENGIVLNHPAVATEDFAATPGSHAARVD